jgi:flagellar motor switch protein FliM
VKPNHDFVAERPLAQHCAELLPPAMPERDLLADCSALARDIAAELAGGMASVASGGAILVTCGEPVRMNTTAFLNRSDSQTAHCVIDQPGTGMILFSVGHGTALALTDRAYGGTGEIPEPLPVTLPISADMTLHQLEATWCAGLGRVLSTGTPPQITRRGGDLGRLDPFRGQAECVHVEISVAQDDHVPWAITLSASLPDLRRLVDRHCQSAGQAAVVHAANDPMAAPFGEVPLSARAVLAQMPISLARASALAPGDIIPLALAREVPLQIGGLTIGLGTVGALDDRVALQITRPFPL